MPAPHPNPGLIWVVDPSIWVVDKAAWDETIPGKTIPGGCISVGLGNMMQTLIGACAASGLVSTAMTLGEKLV